MTTIPGYEVVVTKQPRIAVPPICAGCGGMIEVASSIRTGRLGLTIGLCRACDEARSRSHSAGLRLFKFTSGAGVLVVVALFVLPPLPEVVFFVAPAVGVLLTAALLWRHFRSPLAATRNAWAASPYRSGQSRTTSPTPVAITRVGKMEALVYSANEAWAEEFARLNGFDHRAPTKRPGLRDAPVLVAIAAGLLTGGGLFAWTYQWPTILVDNGSTAPLVIWMDGEPRWTVAPHSGLEDPLGVRVPRGRHRFAYQLPGVSEPTDATNAELPSVWLWLTSWNFRLRPGDGSALPSIMGGARSIYNPGGLVCYYEYEVEYGDYASSREPLAQHLPRSEWSIVDVDHLFETPPHSVDSRSSRTRSVLIRDELCTSFRRRGCADEAVEAAKACLTAASSERTACAGRAAARCRPAPDGAR